MISKKARVSLAFKSKMAQGNITAFGRNIETRVGTNPLFAAFATLATTNLKNSLDNYELRLEDAKGGGTEKTALKNKAKKEVLGVLNTIAQEVNIVANGDETIILAAGFELAKTGERSEADPDPVTGLVAAATLVEGEVLCKLVKGARANKTAFEWALDETPLVRNNGNYGDGQKLLLKGLPSKTWVQIRARSLGASNRNSPWCVPVRVFVY
jgi:hypothetical protein